MECAVREFCVSLRLTLESLVGGAVSRGNDVDNGDVLDIHQQLQWLLTKLNQLQSSYPQLAGSPSVPIKPTLAQPSRSPSPFDSCTRSIDGSYHRSPRSHSPYLYTCRSEPAYSIAEYGSDGACYSLSSEPASISRRLGRSCSQLNKTHIDEERLNMFASAIANRKSADNSEYSAFTTRIVSSMWGPLELRRKSLIKPHKRFWCGLNKGYLFMFQRRDDSHPKMRISLKDYTVSRCTDERFKASKMTLELTKDDEPPIQLIASDISNAGKWVHEINKEIGAIHRRLSSLQQRFYSFRGNRASRILPSNSEISPSLSEIHSQLSVSGWNIDIGSLEWGGWDSKDSNDEPSPNGAKAQIYKIHQCGNTPTLSAEERKWEIEHNASNTLRSILKKKDVPFSALERDRVAESRPENIYNTLTSRPRSLDTATTSGVGKSLTQSEDYMYMHQPQNVGHASAAKVKHLEHSSSVSSHYDIPRNDTFRAHATSNTLNKCPSVKNIEPAKSLPAKQPPAKQPPAEDTGNENSSTSHNVRNIISRLNNGSFLQQSFENMKTTGVKRCMSVVSDFQTAHQSATPKVVRSRETMVRQGYHSSQHGTNCSRNDEAISSLAEPCYANLPSDCSSEMAIYSNS